MKTIKDYIEFAIKNWFDMEKYLKEDWQIKKWVAKWFKSTATISDVELITSARFIEAIGKWIWNRVIKWNYPDIMNNFSALIFLQAMAIHDNKLDKFINELEL